MSITGAGRGPVPPSGLHARSPHLACPSIPEGQEAAVDRDHIDLAMMRPWHASTLPHDLERGYEAASRSSRRKGLRVGLAFMMIVIDLCFTFDVLAGVTAEGAILRFGVVTPLILLSLWCLRRDREIWLESCLVLTPIITVVGAITFLGLAAMPPYTEGYLMAAGMIGFAINLSLPLRIRQALMLYLGNVTIYCSLTMSELVPRHFAQSPTRKELRGFSHL